jgi:hypothetical protein
MAKSQALARSLHRFHPVTFRLPKPGELDEFFGFCRSYYFEGEERGYWKLIRICAEGKKRGVTLIPFREVAAFIAKQGKAK